MRMDAKTFRDRLVVSFTLEEFGQVATRYRNDLQHEAKSLHPNTGAELHEMLFGAGSS